MPQEKSKESNSLYSSRNILSPKIGVGNVVWYGMGGIWGDRFGAGIFM